MSSSKLDEQLAKVLQVLRSAAQSTDPSSTHTKGRVREAFLQLYLRRVLPVSLRVGSGEIVDAQGHATGHCDVVVESRFAPTVPNPLGLDDTLHLAEGVACVIEVKSNIADQWSEVESKAAEVRRLMRSTSGAHTGGHVDYQRVPVYAVGFQGWKTPERIRDCVNNGTVDGVLVLDPAYFYGRLTQDPCSGLAKRVLFERNGPAALWEFAWALFYEVSSVSSLSVWRDAYYPPQAERPES